MSNATITLPQTEYQRLQQMAQKFELIKELLQTDMFAEPSETNPKQIIREFRATGQYNEDFLQSLEQGLKESSYFANPN